MAHELRVAGINRVNISLDTFNREKFYELTGRDLLNKVLQSIEISAKEFDSVRINSVLATENINDVYEFIDFVAMFPKAKVTPRFIPLVRRGCAKGLYEDKSLLTADDIVHAFSEHYGTVSSVPNETMESHNPFARYYKIDCNDLVFGILLYTDSEEVYDSSMSKTLRINPCGYISNDLHSTDIRYLMNLNYFEKRNLISELIKEKCGHSKEWYATSLKTVEPSYDFWRFGGKLETAYSIKAVSLGQPEQPPE